MSDETIGPEQLLIGLANEPFVARLFDKLEIRLPQLLQELQVLPQAEDSHDREKVFTDRSKRIIELAFEESRAMQHLYIGGEHLLLGLLREGESSAARVLERKGLTREKILAELQ